MLVDALLDQVESFVGLEAWRPVAGRGTGTAVSIKFGPAFPRHEPIPNRFLDAKNREYTAHHALFIQDAVWYLRRGAVVVCTSESEDYGFAKKLQVLEGKSVARVILDRQRLDCTFHFDGGFRLEIEAGTAGESFSIFLGSKVFSVEDKELRFEEN